MSLVLFADFTTFEATPASITINLKDSSLLGEASGSAYSTFFSLLLAGTFGGSSIAILGGDGVTFEALMITDPNAATTHTALVMTVPGLYQLNAVCTHLRLDLSGGAAPDVAVALMVQARP